jgi:hypothetical protein
MPAAVEERCRAGVVRRGDGRPERGGLVAEGMRERGGRRRWEEEAWIAPAEVLVKVWVVVLDECLRASRCVGRVPGCSMGSPRSMLKLVAESLSSG